MGHSRQVPLKNGTQDQTPEAIGMFEVLRLLLYLIIINTCSAAHGETKVVDVDGRFIKMSKISNVNTF